MNYEAWKKKQKGRPLLLILSMLGLSFSAIGVYTYFYKPWARHRRLSEAEEFANILIENRKK